MDVEKAVYPVKVLCETLGVTRSGYYAWLGRDKSSWERVNEELCERTVRIHQESRGSYGCPRIQAELRHQGCWVSRKRAWVPKTTDSKHLLPVAPNHLNRNFTQDAPNQAWAGDITYIRTGEGWLYLATLLDLYSRKVVGWAMSDRIDRTLVLNALEMAVQGRRPSPGLIHHTDRGSQYASGDYRQALKGYGMVASMSRKGNCWDNAVAESFFSTLKTELSGVFPNRQVARRAVFEYVEVFYNRKRRHSSIGYLPPVEFEERFNEAQPQCA